MVGLLQGWQAVREEESRRPAAARQEMAPSLGLDSAAQPSFWDGIRFSGPQEQYERLDPLQNTRPRSWRTSVRCCMPMA